MTHTASEQAKDELLSYPNVVAVGHGTERVKGSKTGETALVAFVRAKKPLSELEEDELLPDEIEGVKVDVQEIGDVSIEPIGEVDKCEIDEQSGKDVDPRRRERPYPQGYSIGHEDITAGTAGGIRWVEETEKIAGQEFTYAKPVQVSNNHVTANENRVEEGDMIMQPGPYDGGKKIDDEYRVNGSAPEYVEIDFNGQANELDIAWHDFHDGRQAVSYNPQGGVVSDYYELSEGEEVFKGRSRATPHRKGNVISTDATINVKYDSGVAKFKNQILTESISRGGDSGSQVFITREGETKWVGNLFAGSDKVTVINPAKTILDKTPLHLNPEDVYKE